MNRVLKASINLHVVEDGGSVDPNISKYVGFSLIFGFTVMLILDQTFLILKENQVEAKQNHLREVERQKSHASENKVVHINEKENEQLSEPLLSGIHQTPNFSCSNL